MESKHNSLREKLMIGAFLMMGIIQMIQMSYYYKYESLVMIGIMGIILIICFEKSIIKFTDCNILLIGLLVLLGIVFALNGLFFLEKGSVIEGFTIGFVMPAFLLLFRREEKKKLIIKAFSFSTFIIIQLLLFISIFVAPLGKYQYASILINPNTCAFYVIILISVANYLFTDNKAMIRYISYGEVIAILLFTRSRTAAVAAVLIFILCFIITKKNNKCVSYQTLVKIICICFIVIGAFFFLLAPLSKTIVHNECNTFNKAIIYAEEEHGILSTSEVDEFLRYNETSLVEQIELYFDRSQKGMRSIGNNNYKKYGTISSGRFDIWKATIKNVGIKGHKATDKIVVKSGVYDFRTTNTHNLFLQKFYNYGFFAFLILVCFTCTIIVCYIKIIRQNGYSLEEQFFFNQYNGVCCNYYVVELLHTI